MAGRCCYYLAVLAVASFAFASVRPVAGRAVLISPASRQHLNPSEYSAAGADGKDPAPSAVCGDGGNQATLPVFGERDTWGHPPENVFTAGEVATFTVHIENARKGKFEFRICQYTGAESPSTLNNACLDKHVLQPVAGQSYGGSSRLLPGDPGWWVGESVPYGNAATVTMRYTIPNDIHCDDKTVFCVLQMAYITGNSCNPEHACPEGPPSNCYHVGYNPDCNLRDFQAYRNCADITVSGGKGGGGTPLPVRTPPMITVKPPVHQPRPPASPPTPVSGCCTGKRDGYRRAPKSCRKVCLCKNGKTVRKLHCRFGYNFDENRKKCRSNKTFKC